jgi:hypothetical protein
VKERAFRDGITTEMRDQDHEEHPPRAPWASKEELVSAGDTIIFAGSLRSVSGAPEGRRLSIALPMFWRGTLHLSGSSELLRRSVHPLRQTGKLCKNRRAHQPDEHHKKR